MCVCVCDQASAVPAISEGRSVIMHAYTGSGKTLSYLLPIISRCVCVCACVRACVRACVPAHLVMYARASSLFLVSLTSLLCSRPAH